MQLWHVRVWVTFEDACAVVGDGAALGAHLLNASFKLPSACQLAHTELTKTLEMSGRNKNLLQAN